MRVLVFHGYLLRGTGSNIYNASLVPALARLGHDVHLLCQDRYASELPWVDRFGEWRAGPWGAGVGAGTRPGGGRLGGGPDGSMRVEDASGYSPGEGSVTVYVPHIGGLLPVYVKDEYEGF